MDIRPAGTDEMEAFHSVSKRAVVLPPGLFPPETIELITPEMTLGAFIDGRLATSYAAWPLSMRINGAAVPVAGVTMVGTLPVYRRRGCLRKVITRHFELMHQRAAQPLAVLHASQAAIYQRYGYAVVSTRNAYHTTPSDLVFAVTSMENPVGVLRDLEGADTTVLEQVYERFIAHRTGYLDRTRVMWRTGVLAEPQPGAYLQKIIYEEQGQAMGYLVYTVEPHMDSRGQLGQKMMVRDLAWLSPAAYGGLIHYLTRMDLVHEINWMRAAPDDPLPHLLLEPRKLFTTSGDDLLARIVDVPSALGLRHYDWDGEVTLEIHDSLCPWNQGCWHLTVTSGCGQVADSAKSPQLVMPIDTLAMLYFGQLSASQAARMGRLQVKAEQGLAACDRLLQTRYKPFCADIF